MSVSKTASISLGGLVNTLRELGILNEQDAKRAMGGSTTQHPILALSRMGLEDQRHPGRKLTSLSLSQWLAEQYELPFFSINPLSIDVEKTTDVMSYGFAKNHQILCVDVQPKQLTIATARPDKDSWISSLEQMSRRKIKLVFTSPDEIERYLVEFYSIASSVSGADQKNSGKSTPITNFEQLLEVSGAKDISGTDDKHIVSIVEWLLKYAFDQSASDIHIEPRRQFGVVRFRIDGILHDVYEMPGQVTAAVVSRLKVLGRMDVAEKRRPQDGRIKTRNPKGSEVELRLSTLPTAFGEKLVMRIFDPEVLIRSLAEIGFEAEQKIRWDELLHGNAGLLLVTGPTGSGKTTTLYSSLKQLASRELNLCTLEDPIEMVVDEFNQTQVQTGIGLGFNAGIRTLMRQDPDVIMVGEIRDRDTAEMAMQAALTGHLVLSTLHTNDAVGAISRLLDLGLPAHLIRVTVKGVMAQRLVRMLCRSCREETEMDLQAWQSLVGGALPPPTSLYHAEGCLDCRSTGFRGRTGIYQVMEPSAELRDQIKDNVDLDNLRRVASRNGLRTLRYMGAIKVARGETTIEEVFRVTPGIERE